MAAIQHGRSESKQYVRTKRGTVIANAVEVYLRSDIPCHSPLCTESCANGLFAFSFDVSYTRVPGAFTAHKC